ncbi:MAG TPA: purine-nucleoside phosphorylase [Isosphaeraceae bacterium]|jgi:purine-nucleoside phosphorylase|nr:purine-nucleoside phosphorylase [Isosphaeraceae bacterium]
MSTTPPDIFTRAEEAAAVIRADVPATPHVAVVLGSGLGALADLLADKVILPYATIPHFPVPSVAGHSGNLVAGTLGPTRVVVFQGRFHHYEGHDLTAVTFPIRVLQRLGVKTLILTAATGGIEPTLRPGDLVCITDHLNLIGTNPLRGPNDDRLGIRFPDMSEVYSVRLRKIALEEAEKRGLRLASGVYGCMPGPSYETPAEIRMLRTLGADVVGMSTVPEAIVARHAGMEVLAIAVVSNVAAGIAETPITHAEVLEAGREAGPRLASLLAAVIARLVV